MHFYRIERDGIGPYNYHALSGIETPEKIQNMRRIHGESRPTPQRYDFDPKPEQVFACLTYTDLITWFTGFLEVLEEENFGIYRIEGQMVWCEETWGQCAIINRHIISPVMYPR